MAAQLALPCLAALCTTQVPDLCQYAICHKLLQEQGEGEHEEIPAGHHYAAPEVEEWKPHPYEGEGLHRRESLKVRNML
jgi:hypothetical protein